MTAMAISKIVVSCNSGYGPLTVLYDREENALYFADLASMVFYHDLPVGPLTRR